MKQSCSIRDVANHVGVSPGTVSRVLNNRMGKLHVSDKTREAILSGARELNYVPNIHAKRLFSRRSDVVALVLPTVENLGRSIFRDNHLIEYFSGLQTALAETGYRLLMVFNDQKFVEDKDYLSLFRERSIDAMLVWGACEGETFWEEAINEHYPVMFLTSPSFARDKCNFWFHDYVQAGELAAQYLCGKGHRHIGLVGGFRNHGVIRDLENGIGSVIAKYSGVTIERIYGSYSACDKIMMREFLELQPEITAVMAVNVQLAEAFDAQLKASGIKRKIEIVVCDCSVESLEKSIYPHVRVNDYELGRKSLEKILKLVDGEQEKVQDLCSVELITT